MLKLLCILFPRIAAWLSYAECELAYEDPGPSDWDIATLAFDNWLTWWKDELRGHFELWWDAHILEPIAPLTLRLFIRYRDYLPYEFAYLGKGCPKWLWEAFTAYQDNEKVVVPEGPEGTFTLDQVIAANGWDELPCEITTDELFMNYRIYQLAQYMRWPRISLDDEHRLEAFHGSL